MCTHLLYNLFFQELFRVLECNLLDCSLAKDMFLISLIYSLASYLALFFYLPHPSHFLETSISSWTFVNSTLLCYRFNCKTVLYLGYIDINVHFHFHASFSNEEEIRRLRYPKAWRMQTRYHKAITLLCMGSGGAHNKTISAFLLHCTWNDTLNETIQKQGFCLPKIYCQNYFGISTLWYENLNNFILTGFIKIIVHTTESTLPKHGPFLPF